MARWKPFAGVNGGAFPICSSRTRVRSREGLWGRGLYPGSIDLAFMCDTCHHLEFPQAYMRSLFLTLRPGATLVLVDMKRVEVEQAGFVLRSETDLLEENYYLYFRRP